MEIPSWLSWVAATAAALGYGLTWYYSSALAPWVVQVGVVGLGYAFLWCTSGRLVEFVLAWADEVEDRGEEAGETGAGAASPDGGQEQSADPAATGATDGESPASQVDGASDGGTSTLSQADRDVGTIVGKAENVLLPTFILAEAYTALSVIFAAKGLVRRDDIRKNTLYYLAGTMTNFTYSVAIGFIIRISLEALGVWQGVNVG